MRAVIVEIKDNHAAILSEDGRISKIKNKNYLIGQEIVLRNNSKYVKFAASAAASLIIFVTPAWAYLTPYSYVSLDINPSFEFSINRFDRVLKVSAVNDEGENVIEKISIENLKNKEIKDAVKNVIVELKDQGYIIEGKKNSVIVAASSKNKEKTDMLAVSVKNAVEEEAVFRDDNVDNAKPDKKDKDKQEVVIEIVEEKEEKENAQKTQEKSVKTNEQEQLVKETEKELKKEDRNDKDDNNDKNDKDKSDKKEVREEENDLSKDVKEKEKYDKKQNKSDEKNNKIEVEVIEVSQDDIKEAKDRGVTPGKLNIIGKLREVYPKNDFNEEDWYDKSVQEIMNDIKKYSKDREKEFNQDDKVNNNNKDYKESDKESSESNKKNKN